MGSQVVLHVEGLVPVVAARASPCILHGKGLVTVFAARASPCNLLHAERLGGRVPSLGEDTKCVPSLSGDTRSMPQKIAGMVVHLEDGVDSTLRVSLPGRYTEGQEMSSSKVDEDAPASAGCGIVVVPSWSGNTVSMPPRVAGLVVHLGDDVDSTPRVSLPGRYTEGQEISSSKVGEDAPATARRGIEVVPALRGGTRVAARARSLCDWLHVEGLGRGVLSLSACTEIPAAPDPESEEGQQAAAVAEGGERQRSPCVREQLFLREQKPSFIEVVSMLVCSSVASGAQLEAAAGPESEPAPQAAPGSISERDQRAPPLPYGMSGEIDAVDNCEER